MAFEISKDRIVFPQPGRGLNDGPASLLLGEEVSRLEVVEAGISDVYFNIVVEPSGGGGFSDSNLTGPITVNFASEYPSVPYLKAAIMPLTRRAVGWFYYPSGAMGQILRDFDDGASRPSYSLNFDIHKDRFIIEPSTIGSTHEAGVWGYRLFWDIYNMDYLT